MIVRPFRSIGKRTIDLRPKYYDFGTEQVKLHLFLNRNDNRETFPCHIRMAEVVETREGEDEDLALSTVHSHYYPKMT